MPIDTKPTAEDLRDAFDRYEEMSPKGCVIELIASLEHLAEHDAVAADLADKVRELFAVKTRMVPQRISIPTDNGPYVYETQREVTTVRVLDDLENRVKDAADSRAIEEERISQPLTQVRA